MIPTLSLPIIFAIAAMFCFGVAALLYKVATPDADPISIVLIVYLFAIIFTAFAWYFSPNKFIAKAGLKWMALAACFAFIGMITFVSALKIGQASIVVPVIYVKGGGGMCWLQIRKIIGGLKYAEELITKRGRNENDI